MVKYGKEIVFLYDDESLLRKKNFGITGNAWFNPKAINHLLRSILFPWKGFTFPFEYFFENF